MTKSPAPRPDQGALRGIFPSPPLTGGEIVKQFVYGAVTAFAANVTAVRANARPINSAPALILFMRCPCDPADNSG